VTAVGRIKPTNSPHGLSRPQLWHCDGTGGVTQLHYGFAEYKRRLREGTDLFKNVTKA
jgi:hypothetical protein